MRRNTTLLLLLFAVTTLAASATADEGHRHPRRSPKVPPAAALPAAEVARYQGECGACHLAYPPGLLPARSWARLMAGLEDHFGQNAELDAPTRAALSGWLVAHAAETGSHPRSAKALRGLDAEVPLRISALPYILRKHHELREEVFTRPAVVSRANCGACHRAAEAWVFEEDSVKIPPR